MTRARKDVESGLLCKGFRLDHRHHRYFIYFTLAGKKTPVKTYTSRGSKHKTLSDDLLASMARQCRLNKAQFLQLVDCPLSQEGYEGLVGE